MSATTKHPADSSNTQKSEKSPSQRSSGLLGDLASKLDPLRPFVERTATVRYGTKRLFSSILKASFVRAFEFIDLASTQESRSAFFLVPALRSITEEIILLRFLSRFPHEVSHQTLDNMFNLMAAETLHNQEAFFETFRPFQPVLRSANIASMDIQKVRHELRSFWRNNGWPNLNRDTPPTREIAERSDPELLHVVYDFIYRIVSDAVHFNPRALLRTGWGNTLRETTFSSRNMGDYYLAMCRVYGSYLFCLYFEFFGQFLRPNQEVKSTVRELRKHLLSLHRWPEMITFEEMNVDVPLPTLPSMLLYRMHDAIMTDGFISGTKQIIALRKNQRSRSSKETLRR